MREFVRTYALPVISVILFLAFASFDFEQSGDMFVSNAIAEINTTQQDKNRQGQQIKQANRWKMEKQNQKNASNQQKAESKGQQGPKHVFAGDSPKHDYDIILARPTDRSITFSVLGYRAGKAFISYGVDGKDEMIKSETVELKPEKPVEIVASGLSASTRYNYVISTQFGDSSFKSDEMQSFHTARKPGESFTFAVQADSHLDQATNPATYEMTLSNVNNASPDLFIDLGDTFMTDKYDDFHDSKQQYYAQRYYFGQVGKSTPVFLTLGNHDGERMERGNNRGEDSMPIWANRLRTTLFPNPTPDSFYTGNEKEMPPLGKLQNYFEWKWGDAQFIVLDPFWNTERRGRGDAGGNWARTLGEDQYRWLEKVLNESNAKYKFVFIHHLVGGLDSSARGGSEAAVMYEWGGLGEMNMEEFRKFRPGWAMPIHQLLVRNNVSAVFHGHDHFYAKQSLDGIAYVLVPQPGHQGGERLRDVESYGYKSGLFLPAPGYIRVSVEPDFSKVEYIKTVLPEFQTERLKNLDVADSFRLPIPK